MHGHEALAIEVFNRGDVSAVNSREDHSTEDSVHFTESQVFQCGNPAGAVLHLQTDVVRGIGQDKVDFSALYSGINVAITQRYDHKVVARNLA